MALRITSNLLLIVGGIYFALQLLPYTQTAPHAAIIGVVLCGIVSIVLFCILNIFYIGKITIELKRRQDR